MPKDRKALGTGLSALFGEDISVPSEKIISLPLSKIEPRPDQPRTRFDEDALQALTDSIIKHGVIQPITVRRLSSGYYQIVAGERRWRAARNAGLDEIPVNIIDADDRASAELALVENLQREDLNPIEEALGYKKLIEEYGLTQEEAAKTVGKSRPAVANSLRLLSLSPEVINLVEEDSLSAGHARSLISISNPALQLKAAEKIISGNLSVRSAERLASNIVKSSSPAASGKASEPAVDYSGVLADELSKAFGRKVSIHSGRKGGKIELDFYSDDDREKLIETLRKISRI